MMKETMERRRMSSVVSLQLTYLDDGVRRDGIEGMTERFFDAARALPYGPFIGLQVSFTADGRCQLWGFSEEEVYAAPDDYRWMFSDSVDVGNGAFDDPADRFYGDDRVVYELATENVEVDFYAPVIGAMQTTDAEIHREWYACSLLEAVKKAGGMIRLIAGRGASAMVRLSLPAEVSLTVRAAINKAIPLTVARRLDTSRYDEYCAPYGEVLNDWARREALRGMLAAVMLHQADVANGVVEAGARWHVCVRVAEQEAFRHGQVDAADEKRGHSRVPLEDLNLSIRSYNSLHRAGIRYADDLFLMTDVELQHIRRLGRKGLEEVSAVMKCRYPDRTFAF